MKLEYPVLITKDETPPGECSGLTVTVPDIPEAVGHAWSFDDAIHGGDRACFSPALDAIRLSDFAHFDSAGGYYAMRAHETVHWTGHKSRLDRNLTGGRFGDEAYAVEELVAELGAAFVGAILGIEPQVEEGHAGYIESWLKVLKSDKRAIFTAASAAQKAVDLLCELQESETAAVAA